MSVKTAFLAFAIVCVATFARARAPAGPSPEPAARLVAAALETPYAQALLDKFAAAVRKDGDASCLLAKALDDAALVARGRALLQRRGILMMQVLEDTFDRAAYQSALTSELGSGALAEMERLKRDPDVKALVALQRPAQLAKVAGSIAAQFDRYVLVARLKLAPISPAARGEAELPTDSRQASEAAVRQFLDKHRSRRIDRYLDLNDAAEAARSKGYATPIALKLGPLVYFGGADRDLAELCIGHR